MSYPPIKRFWRFGLADVDAHVYVCIFVPGGRWKRVIGNLYFYFKDNP